MLENMVDLVRDNKSETAWVSYKDIVLTLSRGKRVLEIGAGRRPIFTEKEIEENDISYVANDIMEAELKLSPFETERAVFDITGDVPKDLLGQFDFVFSRMVQEHVSSGEKFYCNINSLMKEGAISLNFFPTLFHPIFTINYLLPSWISAIILQKFHSNRNELEIPKFPAHYEFCYSTNRQIERLKKCGFSEVDVIPFYGQSYVSKVPILSFIMKFIDELFLKYDVRIFSAYAYSFVVK